MKRSILVVTQVPRKTCGHCSEETRVHTYNGIHQLVSAVTTEDWKDRDDLDKNYFYLKDIRGSVTSVVDDAMAGVTSYEYDDFGITTVNGDQDFENQICYTGGIYDELTGLYYLNARYYDPEVGRFLTEDTYRGETDDFDTWHLYAYCANNPVNYTDSSGHSMALAGGVYVSYKVVAGIYTLCKVAVVVGSTIIIAGQTYKITKIVNSTGIGTRKKTKVKLKKQATVKSVTKSKKGSTKKVIKMRIKRLEITESKMNK